jgi:riboflavin kinase/FMN adenylyltransferase
MFFDPHPTSVLAPERAPTLLTEPARRAELLRGAGVSDVLVLPFDQGFASMSPETFVKEVLVDRCAARGVVVGPDFHFGHKRAGNIDLLRTLGATHGFDVTVVPPVVVGGAPSSSTRIRGCLREGLVAEANEMLTRLHEVEGTVVEGDKRGRTLGFPTANLGDIRVQCPADGVYAVVVRRLSDSGPLLHGVANVGVRPTMGAGRSFEVFLFDFDGDIYGERLRIGIAARIRGEQKFASLDALVAQINTDVRDARRALASERPEMLAWL